jgi:hypothetical protein
MKLTAAIRRRSRASSFAIPELKKYWLVDVRHVGSAIKYFRENKQRYPVAMRKAAGDRIALAYLKFHYPFLKPRERMALVRSTRKALVL